MDRQALVLKALLFESFLGKTISSELKDVRVLYDLKFKCDWLRRKETQVDVVAITSKAIYVIEAKDWSNYIEGDFDQYEWRGMGDSLKNMTVVSPIMQNLMHIRFIKAKALMHDLELPPLISIVCVPDECKIYSKCKEIIHASDLVSIIQACDNKLSKSYDRFKYEKFLRKCR